MALPGWLSEAGACPWNSRAEFLADRQGPRLNSLRGLLSQTVALQARFCANRLEAALPKMLAALPDNERERVKRQFYRVAASPNGVYALVDYVNFKGEGVLATERYHGEGWGLLQVLAGMKGESAGTKCGGNFGLRRVRLPRPHEPGCQRAGRAAGKSLAGRLEEPG